MCKKNEAGGLDADLHHHQGGQSIVDADQDVLVFTFRSHKDVHVLFTAKHVGVILFFFFLSLLILLSILLFLLLLMLRDPDHLDPEKPPKLLPEGRLLPQRPLLVPEQDPSLQRRDLAQRRQQRRVQLREVDQIAGHDKVHGALGEKGLRVGRIAPGEGLDLDVRTAGG